MMVTSRDRFRQLLDDAPDEAEAIEYEGQWVSWGVLRELDRQLDSLLSQDHLGVGARVGLVIENKPEHVGTLLSLIARERCIVTLSGLEPPERLAASIARAQLPVLIATPEALARPGVVAAAEDALVLELNPTGVRVAAKGSRAPRPSDVEPGTIVAMLTSGTTGPPKRVLLGEKQFDAAIATSVPAPPVTGLFRSGVTLVVTPMVHIGGFWGALGPLYSGRRIALMGKFVLERWLAAIARHRPRATGLVPAALRTILDNDVPAEELQPVEVITTGTTACPPELIDAFLHRYGIRILPTYGATEFAGAVAFWSRDLHEQWWTRKAGSAGHPVPGVRLRVTDDAGNQLPAGQVGRLEIRTAQSPVGAGEWLRASDLATIDTDGFLWIRGRADDVIIRGGFKIRPDAVREVLEIHPCVREAAVAPLPDERLGEVPVAGVEPASDVDARALADELIALCRERLLPYEVPVHVAVLPALPRTPSSKVSRTDLLDLIVSDMATRTSV